MGTAFLSQDMTQKSLIVSREARRKMWYPKLVDSAQPPAANGNKRAEPWWRVVALRTTYVFRVFPPLQYHQVCCCCSQHLEELCQLGRE
jgi:hypothetical protein